MPSAHSRYRILVLGGYGNFGGRICRALAGDATLVIAGRDALKARAAATSLGAAHEAIALDFTAPDLGARLRERRIDAVVHTCGPFQGQSYHVARASIEAGAHYIDLADGRSFVAGITALDGAARERGVLIASGASTLPALSSAVVDEHLARFSRLDSIDISIAPGQRTPRGVATLEAVLSYCGKPFPVWEHGGWRTAYGWRDLHRFRFPDLGARWLARCDVPDLQLFPAHYAALGVQRVRFDAGLELAVAQGAFWLLAAAVQAGLFDNASRFARRLQSWGKHFDRLGSDVGGMHVSLTGRDHERRTVRLDWHLLALHGHGPEIPCLPAIVLARKLAAGTMSARGAMPCMGLITLVELARAVKAAQLDISWRSVWS